MGWVVTYLLICMVVFCLLIQWGVVATILFPKSFVVLVVIMVIFMLSSPTCFGIRERIGGIIYVWYVYYQTFLTKFVWCTFMLRLHHSYLKKPKTNKFYVKNVFREIRQQKIYKPLSNHLKYVYRFDVKSFFNSEKCSNMTNPFQIISGMSGFRFNM